jgi:hypothetical protein
VLTVEDKLTVSHDDGGTRQERAELLLGGYMDKRHFDDLVFIIKDVLLVLRMKTMDDF